MNLTTHFSGLLLLLSINLFGQNDLPVRSDSTVAKFTITLKDGTQLTGQLVEQTPEHYIIKTDNLGTIKINKDQVVSMLPVGQKADIRTRSLYYENQFAFRYFLFNSALPVEPKKGYYSNSYLLFSNFNYGLSKRLSVGATFFTFNPTALISPRLRYAINPTGKVKFSIIGQYLYARASSTSGRDYHYNYGLVQAVMTVGSSQRNLTLGVGRFITNQGENGGYILLVAVSTKISAKVSFISENNLLMGSLDPSSTQSILEDSFTMLSAGFRFNRKKHAFDVGVYVPSSFWRDEGNTIPLPYVGYNLKLGK